MNRKAADIILILMTVIGASSTVVAKVLLQSTPPLYFLSIRFLAASTALFCLSPRLLRNVNRQTLKGGLSVAAGFGFGCIFLYYGLSVADSGHASFIINLGVVIVPLYMWLFAKTRPLRNEWIALTLAMIGLFFFTFNGKNGVNWSDGILLLSAASYAVSTVALSAYAPYCNTRQLSLIAFIFIALACSGASFFLETGQSIAWSQWAWVLFGYIVLVATVIRFLGQSWAQKSTTSTHTALIFTLEPVFTGLLSVLFLGEHFTNQKMLGGLLIFSASLLVTLGRFNQDIVDFKKNEVA